MSKDKLLKDINRKWLISYLLFHVVLFSIFVSALSPTFNDINGLLSKLKSPSGFFPLLSFLIAIILEGLIHSKYKAVLIFWRFKNPLPGSRAFTDIAPNDYRIDMASLEQLFPDGLPEEPPDQNAKWYNLYRQFMDKPIVYDAHRFFLLTRDLASISIALIPISIVAHIFWNSSPSVTLYHEITLAVLFIVISFSSQNYGKRFVANVLVEALTQDNQIKEG